MNTFTLATAQSLVNSEDNFPVNFDNAWGWLGYSAKDKAKRKFLNCGFIEGTDFTLTISGERLNGVYYSDRITKNGSFRFR